MLLEIFVPKYEHKMSSEIERLDMLMSSQTKILQRLLAQSKLQTELLQVTLTSVQKKKLEALKLAATAERAATAARTNAAAALK